MADSLKQSWGYSGCDPIIELFQEESENNRIVCDVLSGEEICGFFRDMHLVAYIHLKFPIGFVKKEFMCFINKVKVRIPIHVHLVIIKDFFDLEWHVNLNALKLIAPEISWNASVDAVNPDCFSIDGFRFATH